MRARQWDLSLGEFVCGAILLKLLLHFACLQARRVVQDQVRQHAEGVPGGEADDEQIWTQHGLRQTMTRS